MSWKRSLTLWILVLALSIIWLGCPKKKPVTTPQPTTSQETVKQPAQEVSQAPAPSTSKDIQENPLSKDIQSVNTYLDEKGLIGDVFFDFDKYNLKADARDRLAKNADFIKEHPNMIFTIEGHCDERGTNEYNLALGERRANAARDYLTSLGVPPSQLKTISYGEERPFCTEHTEACWAKNRRDHFVFTERTNAG